MPFPLLLSYKQTERNLKRLNLNLLFKGQNSETLTFFFLFFFWCHQKRFGAREGFGVRRPNSLPSAQGKLGSGRAQLDGPCHGGQELEMGTLGCGAGAGRIVPQRSLAEKTPPASLLSVCTLC